MPGLGPWGNHLWDIPGPGAWILSLVSSELQISLDKVGDDYRPCDFSILFHGYLFLPLSPHHSKLPLELVALPYSYLHFLLLAKG